jgi:hypothetical protein
MAEARGYDIQRKFTGKGARRALIGKDLNIVKGSFQTGPGAAGRARRRLSVILNFENVVSSS